MIGRYQGWRSAASQLLQQHGYTSLRLQAPGHQLPKLLATKPLLRHILEVLRSLDYLDYGLMAHEFVFQAQMKRQPSTEWDLFFSPPTTDTSPRSDFYSLLVKNIAVSLCDQDTLVFPKPASTRVPPLQNFQYIPSSSALHHRVHSTGTDGPAWCVPCGSKRGYNPQFERKPWRWAWCEHSRATTQQGPVTPDFEVPTTLFTPLFFKLYFRKVLPDI